ncbi:MAG TPA: alpha/beta fold hydrolase [Candidatus Eisenbacteria bacterium]|nr:alpha/beta fold hydrolase [Candidatus Eisenbacteria bacterium]
MSTSNDTGGLGRGSRESAAPAERDRDLAAGRRVRQLVIRSPAGALEAVLFCRAEEDPRAVAVFCHPHPQFGGSMHNKVAYRSAEALFEAGLPTLRFNFRGVGRSEGEWSGGPGEEEDAAAAIGFLLGLYPGRRLLLGGFSFGAGVALAQGARDPRVHALLAVAPGAGRRDFSFLARSAKPKAVIQGTADELCPLDDLQASYPAWAEPKWMRLLEGAGHFFEGRLPELQQAVREVLDLPAFQSALAPEADALR